MSANDERIGVLGASRSEPCLTEHSHWPCNSGGSQLGANAHVQVVERSKVAVLQ